MTITPVAMTANADTAISHSDGRKMAQSMPVANAIVKMAAAFVICLIKNLSRPKLNASFYARERYSVTFYFALRSRGGYFLPARKV